MNEQSDTPETDDAYKQRDGEGEWDYRVRREKTMEKLERDRNQQQRWKDEWIECSHKQDDRIAELEAAIRETIMANLHLADGDDCTLKRLKDAIGFELPPEGGDQ